MNSGLDPAVLAAIEAAEQRGRIPFELQTPEQARAAYRAGCALTGPEPQAMASVSDGLLPGTPVPFRLYRPRDEARLPALMYLHGGGWVIGDLDTHDGVCRRLAAETGCAVLAVDYRLAPEHAFPCAFDDALAAWQSLHQAADALGLDGTRLGLAGDSAGAGLAAAVALAARDEGRLPTARCQLLFYPVTDLCCSSDSHAHGHARMFLSARTMQWFRQHYAPEPQAWQDWRASPLRATSLAGLPPCWLLSVGHDPLCDEGIAYAQRLARSGTPVSHLHLSDQTHGLLTQSRLMPASQRVWAQAAAFARQHLFTLS